MKQKTVKKMRGFSVVILAVIVAFAFMPLSGFSGEAFASGGGSMTTAKPLDMNTMEKGTCEFEKKVYYKFNTSSHDATYYVKACGEEFSDNKGKSMDVAIYDAHGEFLIGGLQLDAQDILSVKIAQSGLDAIKLEKNSTYYIELWYRDGDSDSDGKYFTYSVGVDEKITKPAKTVIRSAKAGKKKLTVKWNAAKRATDYQVAYKKKGAAKWKYKTTAKRFYTIKKLKSKKKYVVKVRGYKTYNGKKYFGAWSKIKTVKIK